MNKNYAIFLSNPSAYLKRYEALALCALASFNFIFLKKIHFLQKKVCNVKGKLTFCGVN
ncbi:MAG: hypothetical protein CNLJKLNK_00884 [Holosporales bacterium]